MAKPKSNPVKNDQDLIDYLGLANGTFTSWRYKGGKSYLLHIDKIAEFLEVTPNYLLKGIDENVNKDTLSAIEIELISLFRRMEIDKRQTFIAVAHHFVE